MTAEFFAGRHHATIAKPYKGTDQIFGSQRLDGESVEEPSYSHCTFANISFKDGKIVGGKFENCVFLACYFRTTQLKGVEFLGCKFIDCLFPSVAIDQCVFRFPLFRGSSIELQRIEACFPEAPHERFLMAANLEAEAQKIGEAGQAHKFRLEAISAWEKHLWCAWKADNEYYQSHYPTTRDRMSQLVGFLRSKIVGFIWGHGERGFVLVRNFGALALGIFPMLFWILKEQFRLDTGDKARGWDFFLLSLGSILPGDWAPNVATSTHLVQFVRSIEALLGVLFAGMLISLLLKSVSRR